MFNNPKQIDWNKAETETSLRRCTLMLSIYFHKTSAPNVSFTVGNFLYMYLYHIYMLGVKCLPLHSPSVCELEVSDFTCCQGHTMAASDLVCTVAETHTDGEFLWIPGNREHLPVCCKAHNKLPKAYKDCLLKLTPFILMDPTEKLSTFKGWEAYIKSVPQLLAEKDFRGHWRRHWLL